METQLEQGGGKRKTMKSLIFWGNTGGSGARSSAKMKEKILYKCEMKEGCQYEAGLCEVK